MELDLELELQLAWELEWELELKPRIPREFRPGTPKSTFWATTTLLGIL